MTTGARGDIFRRLATVAFFTAPLGAALAPNLTTIFLPLLVVILILAAMWHGPRWWESLAPNTALVGCLAFSAYVFLNATWSLNPTAGVAKAFLLLGLILAVPLVSLAVDALNERQTRAFSLAFVVGAVLAIVYLLVEMLMAGAIARFVFGAFPAIRPDYAQQIELVGDAVTYINLSTFNENLTTLMLNLWPALLILAAIVSRQWRFVAMAAVFIGTVLAVFASKHSSSQVALLASALMFAAALKWSRLVIHTLAVMWCLAFALVLPASFVAHDANLHTHPSLPTTYKQRVIIWDYTAEKTLEHPWLGIGVDSTREINIARKEAASLRAKPKGEIYPRSTGHHAHSLFLQTWHELGAIGAILLALAGALVILRTGTLPKDVQPYAAAAFTTFAAIAAFAWGMWQGWWMCAAGLMAVYLFLGRQCHAVESTPPPGSGGEAPRPHS